MVAELQFFLPTLIKTPSENIFMKPGDAVYALRKKQAFIAVGALGSITQTEGLTGRFEFPEARMSAGGRNCGGWRFAGYPVRR